jgi:hypothetical protein
MNTCKEKQLVLKAMRTIFYKGVVNRVDWMGYLITEDNKPSYHHIVKKEELINNNQSCAPTIENGAYLGTRSHELLHQLELIDHDLYECWNDLFLMINNMKIYPVDHVWDMVYKLQEETVDVLNDYKNAKRLIK